MRITDEERRVFRRIAVEAAVTVRLGDVELQGTCKNLSSSGMSIQLLEANMNPHDQIQVRLVTRNHHIPPLNIEAEVLGVQDKGGIYIVAAEFLKIKSGYYGSEH